MSNVVRTRRIPQRVAIIDGNISQAHDLQKHLRALGTSFIQIFQNPEDGIQAIMSGNFTCAIIDWKLTDKTSGFSVLSRLRRISELANFPVVITVTSLKQSNLLTFMGFQTTRFLERPIKNKNLSLVLSSLYSECEWYKSNQREIANILRMAQLNGAHALTALRRLSVAAPNPGPFTILVARQLISQGFYQQAAELFEDILKNDPNHISALNAKALLQRRMGKTLEAIATLRLVQDLTRDLPEKISEIGSEHISLKDPEKAVSLYRTALDHKGLRVNTETKYLAADALDHNLARQISIAAEPSVARVLNNSAISLAYDGKLERALKYYFMSFAYLNDRNLQSKVSFNIGLGFQRWKKPAQAKYWLEMSVKLAEGGFLKAEHHLLALKGVVGRAGLDDVLKPLNQAAPQPVPARPIIAAKPTPKPLAPKPTKTIVPHNAKGAPAKSTNDRWELMLEDLDGMNSKPYVENDFDLDEHI